MKYSKIKWCIVSAVLAFTLGCSERDTSHVSESETLASPILATVNGENITVDDLSFAINRTFSQADQMFLNESVEHKVLESLIAAKSMRHEMEKTLDQGSIDEIQMKVNAYEEELYVKSYLGEHISPEPVTSEMVEDYYQNNAELFGGGVVKTVELLTLPVNPGEAERDIFLGAVNAFKGNANWEELAQNKFKGLDLQYKKAKIQPGLFSKEIEAAVVALGEGEVSNVVYTAKTPTILRVLEVLTLPSKPLHEVSAEIRKRLAPLQLKKAVKQASQQAIANAEVTRSSGAAD